MQEPAPWITTSISCKSSIQSRSKIRQPEIVRNFHLVKAFWNMAYRLAELATVMAKSILNWNNNWIDSIKNTQRRHFRIIKLLRLLIWTNNWRMNKIITNYTTLSLTKGAVTTPSRTRTPLMTTFKIQAKFLKVTTSTALKYHLLHRKTTRKQYFKSESRHH